MQYYALLREQAGRSDETLTTGARDAARAVRRAARAISVHAAAGDAARGRQRRIRRLAQPLKAGDAVVFIPPVAGG